MLRAVEECLVNRHLLGSLAGGFVHEGSTTSKSGITKPTGPF
jgi:hypothetical protein